MAFDIALDIRAELGESPVWSTAEQTLYFVDIKGQSIHAFRPGTGVHQRIVVPEDIGCIGLRHGGGFIAGLRSGIWLIGAEGTLERKLADNPEDTTNSRFNDGKVAPGNRFMLGTIDEQRRGQTASIYRYHDGRLEAVASGLTTSNGLAFSPDGRTLYHSDTPRRTVWRRDYQPDTGALGDPSVFIQTREEDGRPDGAAVDAEGCYWVALYVGGRVRRYSPDGRLLEEHLLPVRCPTMVAFGGADLRTLYVTSARAGRSDDELQAHPHSGSLFSMAVTVPGLPAVAFDASREMQ
ncbi:SMP-30/gluconolactonase/LRE family protein [Rhizobium halophytocola]|uniref:Sugar lactone lactonase YvrE n=1 Tax=Rhizobium halophytocola TaxID=735519 RepID=A0ABS4E4V6_9HYPH|nr:SMP-30/gluconolactonase/LRE family protein [Rhizobium halophytocola]MBP1852978.1 sugar lactone lactonase YvrE [Rhizobium halophytocola]